MWGKGSQIALLACGSFNPPTFMHLRMMELAREILETEFKCDVVEGILSPVADGYAKPNLAPAQHRLNMLTIATRDSDWLIPDGWEASQGTWTRTREALRYHQQRVHKKYGPDVRVVLVAGGDFVSSFRSKLESGEWLWHKEDLVNIVKQYGLICLVREGLRAHTVFDSLNFLANYKDFCLVSIFSNYIYI